MTELNQHDQREVVKQAIKEWMDDRYADIGRWAVKTVLIAGLTYFLFKYVEFRGWKLP